MNIKRISAVEILLWTFAFLLILLVVSPFGLGFKIKNDYPAVLAGVSDLVQADIKIISYDRGFYSSSVILDIALPDVPFKLQLKENIIHGPVYLGLINQGKSPFVAAVVTGELVPPAELAVQINQLFSGKAPMLYQNVIEFSGSMTSESYMPPINTIITAEGNDISIRSSGLTLVSRYFPAEGRLSGESSLPTLLISTDTDKMEIQRLNLNFSGIKGNNNLLIGDSILTLGLLDYHSNGEQLSVRSFNVQTMTNEQGKFLNSQLQMNAQEILASNVKLGPVAFNVSIKGLDADKLIELQDIQKDMQQKLEQGIPEEQVTAMYAGQMLGILPDLLKQSEININPLKVESDIGALTSDLAFSIEGLDASAPADPLFILNAINLDIGLQIDEGLLQQIVKWQLQANDQMVTGDAITRRKEAAIPIDQKVSENIQGLLDEDWLVKDNSVYQSHISFHQGQMLLNGKPVDPIAHLMSQMAAPGR
ncbi:MAG: YdgA family protein [Gammaproteobacteria bacterium]|nr:YdgA family protein [Gammaproteobacteria bacterium]